MILSKKLFLIVAGVLSLKFAQAQSSMKAPVSFQLKNGITVVMAENTGMQKVYASLAIENGTAKNDATVALDNLLNQQAEKSLASSFKNNADKVLVPSVTFTNMEGNVAASAEDFNKTLMIMASTFHDAKISNATKEIKDIYNQQSTPSKTLVTIAGDITLSQAKAIANKAFGDWKAEDFIASK